MYSAFVHGEGGRLSVRLATVPADVRLGMCVHHMVFVERGVLRETFPAALNSAHVGLLS